MGKMKDFLLHKQEQSERLLGARTCLREDQVPVERLSVSDLESLGVGHKVLSPGGAPCGFAGESILRACGQEDFYD